MPTNPTPAQQGETQLKDEAIRLCLEMGLPDNRACIHLAENYLNSRAAVDGPQIDPDIIADRLFIAGAEFGWNCGVTGDAAKLEAAVRVRRAEVHAAISSTTPAPSLSALLATAGIKCVHDVPEGLTCAICGPIRNDDPPAPAERTRVEGEQEVENFRIRSPIRVREIDDARIERLTAQLEGLMNLLATSQREVERLRAAAIPPASISESARRAASEICAYFGDTELAMGEHVNANGVAAIVSKHFAAAQPVAMRGRVVNINTHGEPTRARLREIETSVSNGYERECRELGWSRALQSTLRDLHFLLTFFGHDVTNDAAPADNDAALTRAALAFANGQEMSQTELESLKVRLAAALRVLSDPGLLEKVAAD